MAVLWVLFVLQIGSLSWCYSYSKPLWYRLRSLSKWMDINHLSIVIVVFFNLICRRRKCREHTEHARVKRWQPSDASGSVAEGGHSSRQISNRQREHQLWRGVVADGGSFLPQGFHYDLPHHHYHRTSSVHTQALSEKACCPGSKTVRFRR